MKEKSRYVENPAASMTYNYVATWASVLKNKGLNSYRHNEFVHQSTWIDIHFGKRHLCRHARWMTWELAFSNPVINNFARSDRVAVHARAHGVYLTRVSILSVVSVLVSVGGRGEFAVGLDNHNMFQSVTLGFNQRSVHSLYFHASNGNSRRKTRSR